MEELIHKLYEQAHKLGACDLFTGRERTLNDIVSLFLSVQGLEFCFKKHFPNIATFRLFKRYDADLGKKYGIYIDAGSVTLRDPRRVVLIGRTDAQVLCQSPDTAHEVYVLRGASAMVIASGWAVVKVEAETACSVIKKTNDNAIIL